MPDKPIDQELDPCTMVVTCVLLRRCPDGSGGAEVLILKRAETEEEGPGLWTIPGGKVQKGDLGAAIPNASSQSLWGDVLHRAILREIKEETGILGPEMGIVPLFRTDKVFVRRNGSLTFVFVYLAELYFMKREVQVADGATEYRWVHSRELDCFSFIGNVKEDIREALHFFAEREAELRRPRVSGMDPRPFDFYRQCQGH